MAKNPNNPGKTDLIHVQEDPISFCGTTILNETSVSSVIFKPEFNS
jgi:hypothetical protein